MNKKEESLFAMVTPSTSGRTLDQLADDVFALYGGPNRLDNFL